MASLANRRLWPIYLALIVALALPGAAFGQSASAPSLEANLGVSTGTGGTFYNRAGVAFDVLLGWRLRATETSALVGGLAGGVHGPIAGSDICALGRDGECLPDFPLLLSVGPLIGVQRSAASGSSLRALAGPAYYQGGEGGSALGLQGRLDVATPPFLRTAVVASLRGAMLPSFEGNTLGVAAFGLGLRIQ